MAQRYSAHEKDLLSIFGDIRRAKEQKAQSTADERNRINEERKNAIEQRLHVFTKRGENGQENIDLDAEELWLQEEIARVRSGKLHKYTSNDFVQSDNVEQDSSEFVADFQANEEDELLDIDDYLRDAASPIPASDAAQSEEAGEQHDVRDEVTVDFAEEESEDLIDIDEYVYGSETQSAEPVSAEPVSEQPLDDTETDEDIDLLGAVQDTTVVTIAVWQYEKPANVAQAYTCVWYVTRPNDEEEAAVNNMRCCWGETAESALFAGATDLLKELLAAGDMDAIIQTDSDSANLLRQNATYGMTGNYGPQCAAFIRTARTAAEKCYLRIRAVDSKDLMSLKGYFTKTGDAETQNLNGRQNEDAESLPAIEPSADRNTANEKQEKSDATDLAHDFPIKTSDEDVVLNFDF